MTEFPRLTGLHHVSVPTSDPLAGSDWYVRVFGFTRVLVEEQEVLRLAAAPVAALGGYPLFGLMGTDQRVLDGILVSDWEADYRAASR